MKSMAEKLWVGLLIVSWIGMALLYWPVAVLFLIVIALARLATLR